MKLLAALPILAIAATTTHAGNYREDSYCWEGREVRCLIGPYANECVYTGQACKNVGVNVEDVRSGVEENETERHNVAIRGTNKK